MFKLGSIEEVESVERDRLLLAAVVEKDQLVVEFGWRVGDDRLQGQLGVVQLVVVEVNDDAAVVTTTS